jgi:hypothetical protein
VLFHGYVAAINTNTNCTAEMESQKIDDVVAVAEKYLGVGDLTSEELQCVLSGSVPSSQVVGLG